MSLADVDRRFGDAVDALELLERAALAGAVEDVVDMAGALGCLHRDLQATLSMMREEIGVRAAAATTGGES